MKPRTTRSAGLAERLFDRLRNGESLRAATSDPGMPSQRFFHDWLSDDPEFAQQYARAREAQAEYYADAIVELSDGATPETANAVRLQIDARKWVAAKLLPKKYGEKPAETHVNNTVNNFVVFPPERLHELQERKSMALRA